MSMMALQAPEITTASQKFKSLYCYFKCMYTDCTGKCHMPVGEISFLFIFSSIFVINLQHFKLFLKNAQSELLQ